MEDWVLALIIVGSLVVVFVIWRTWFLREDGVMRPINYFRPFKLVNKQTMATTQDGVPIRRFTFALPEHHSLASMGFDLGLGDFIKISTGSGKAKAYSPTSPVGRLGSFDLTVKIYKGGRISEGYLDALDIGQSAQICGPGPVPWIRMRRNGGSHVGLIAFGIGITELRPVVASELADPAVKSVILLWANRHWCEVFETKQLEALEKASGGRFKVVYTLSREEKDGCLKGRVSAEVLKQAFAPFLALPLDQQQSVRIQAVGTKEMQRAGYSLARELGFPTPLLRKGPACVCLPCWPSRDNSPGHATARAEDQEDPMEYTPPAAQPLPEKQLKQNLIPDHKN